MGIITYKRMDLLAAVNMNWDITIALTVYIVLMCKVFNYVNCDTGGGGGDGGGVNHSVVVPPGIDPRQDGMWSNGGSNDTRDNTDINLVLHSVESCFDVPSQCSPDESIDCWAVPENTSLRLNHCDTHQHIEIVDVRYIRPNERGDQCNSVACFGNACCCRKYIQNCSITVKQQHGGGNDLYNTIVDSCNNNSVCDIYVPSIAMESMPMFTDVCGITGCNSFKNRRIGRCWARVIQILYYCHEPPDIVPTVIPVIPVTDSTAKTFTTTVEPSTSPSIISLGLLLGVSIGSVIIILILVLTIMCLCISSRKKKKMWSDKKTTQLQQHIEFNNLTTDGSTLQLCENESVTPANSGAHSTMDWHYPGAGKHTDTLDSCIKQPLPPTPEMVENNYYESAGLLTISKQTDEEKPPANSDNFFEGVASACSAIGYDVKTAAAAGVENEYYDENLRKPNCRVDDENKENYLKEKFSGCSDLPDTENNNHNMENIYETIPETGYKGGPLQGGPLQGGPLGPPQIGLNSGQLHTGPALSIFKGPLSNSVHNNKSRDLKNQTLPNPAKSDKSRWQKHQTISKVDMDLPLIRPSNHTLESRRRDRRDRDNITEDPYTYTYGHFTAEGRNREPRHKDLPVLSETDSYYNNTNRK